MKGHEKLAARIAAWIEQVQSGFATVMNKRFSSMPVRRLRTWLVVWVVAGSLLSAWCIVKALSGRVKENFPVDNIRVIEIRSDSLEFLEDVYKSYRYE